MGKRLTKKEREKTDTIAQVGAGTGAVLGGKTLYDNGFTDGRRTVYHGTTEAAANKIRKEGLLAKYTGAGSKEAVGVTDAVLKGKAKTESHGKVFMTPSYLEAIEYALSHDKPIRGGVPGQKGNLFKGVVRLRLPPSVYNKKVLNPEILGAKNPDEFTSRLIKNNPIAALNSERELAGAYRGLKQAVVIPGNVGTEYIKGSGKYKRVNLSEYKSFLRNHPGRAGIGMLGMAGVAGLTTLAANRKARDKYLGVMY